MASMMKSSIEEELPPYNARSIQVYSQKQKQQNSSLFRALKQNKETKEFAGLLEKMSYAVTIPYSSYTIMFVPSNESIQEVAKTLPSNFFNLQSTLDLLRYHVSHEEIDPDKLLDSKMLMKISTNYGDKVICVQRDGTKIKLNGSATILKVIKSNNMDDEKFAFVLIDKILPIPNTFECKMK